MSSIRWSPLSIWAYSKIGLFVVCMSVYVVCMRVFVVCMRVFVVCMSAFVLFFT